MINFIISFNLQFLTPHTINSCPIKKIVKLFFRNDYLWLFIVWKLDSQRLMKTIQSTNLTIPFMLSELGTFTLK